MTCVLTIISNGFRITSRNMLSCDYKVYIELDAVL